MRVAVTANAHTSAHKSKGLHVQRTALEAPNAESKKYWPIGTWDMGPRRSSQQPTNPTRQRPADFRTPNKSRQRKRNSEHGTSQVNRHGCVETGSEPGRCPGSPGAEGSVSCQDTKEGRHLAAPPAVSAPVLLRAMAACKIGACRKTTKAERRHNATALSARATHVQIHNQYGQT